VFRLFVAVAGAAALALGGVGSLAPTEPAAAPATRCVPPSFRGQYYWQHTLRTVSVRVGERVGAARFFRNVNLQCLAEWRSVHRLKAVPIGRALSVGGSSRVLLVRLGICQLGGRSDAWFIRCLAGA
jgi:hypothetical protein